jgi:hypothetical protein
MVARDPAELPGLIVEQMDWLRTSAARFDAGTSSEAKRLAGVLRTLLHHNPSSGSRSLLAQAGLLEALQYLDSAGEIRPDIVTFGGQLTVMRMHFSDGGAGDEGRVTYEPRLAIQDAPRLPVREQIRRRIAGLEVPRPAGQMVPFAVWWDQAVIQDTKGHLFSRGDLVRALANKEGGAHVDPQLSAAYHALSRSNSLGLNFGAGDSDQQPLGTPVPAAVRQIAWELEESLRRQAPDLLPV